MARKKREWHPGAVYHVMSRGVRKGALFKDDYDYYFFLEQIRSIQETYSFRLHSICLMTNHFHMLIETEDIEIWKIMQKILTLYACYFNQKYSVRGHVFEGRYASSMIEDDIYFLEVSRYIHLNPVKAHMVRDPLSYEYSSYRLFVSDQDTSKSGKITSALYQLVDTSRVLRVFSHHQLA